jgi:YidC/Oxa1 family membrane protein insertase
LWIADLSEPEGLLAGVLPFPAGGLNILPLLMTATMVLQQRLTPSAGDPQQQKMMAFMPIMMLFIFYNMPSGLVLVLVGEPGLVDSAVVPAARSPRPLRSNGLCR